MPKRWSYWVAWGTIAAVAAGGADLLGKLRFFQLLSLKAYDTNFILRGKRPAKDIVLVVADEKTLNTFDDLQAFFHPYYAQAIKGAELGGAKVVGLDAAFAIPVTRWAPDNDRVMAEAVATAQIPVVVGFIPALMGKQQEWVIPVNMIASAMGLAGYSNLTADLDDFVRRQELIEAPAAGASPDTPLARSFPLRIAEKVLNQDARFEQGRLVLNGNTIPAQDRTIPINFAGPADTFPRISLSDFVAATKSKNIQQLKNWVDGKIVLIGIDSVGDRYSTPFFTLFQGAKWTTAGVEIHASTLSTILDRAYILPVPGWIRVVSMIMIAMLTFGAAASLRGRLVAISVLAILGLALGVSQILFQLGYTLSASDLAMCWLTSLVASMVYRFVTAEQRRDHFRRAVALFVGKNVATSLDQSTDIALSGTRQLVTIMFTDIRGFTAFCEDKDPSEVVTLLNEYMRNMVSIIVKYRGQVNKFIGDGILAIFSDDEGKELGEHPLRAVLCATEMVSAPGRFKTGAGLHTGLAVVGNVGSQDKMEYTVLGDTVNLASRLESLNKEKKTKLLMSAATQAFLDGRVDVTQLGSVPVRGQSEPIEIFTVSSLLAETAPAETGEHAGKVN